MASAAPEGFMLLSSFWSCLLYISPGRDEQRLLGEEATSRYSLQGQPRDGSQSSGSLEGKMLEETLS